MRQGKARRTRGFCGCGSSLLYEHCCKGRDMNPGFWRARVGHVRRELRVQRANARRRGGQVDSVLESGLVRMLKGFMARLTGLRRRGDR